ncbi:MAG: hypothetical protein NC123_20225 [Butyrivibrio sp.]|nr:hypothetical protein [Butyrivibrio sp.]
MTLVERIKLKCKENHTSMNALEGELGFGNGTLRRWDERTPGADRLLILANRLNTSVDWLLTGKTPEDLTPEEKKLIDLYRSADERGRRAIIRTAEAENMEQESSDSKIG